MNSIDQKFKNKLKERLKKDAHAFSKVPSKNVHDSIMQSIRPIKKTREQSLSSKIINGLTPSGFVVAALILVVINLTPDSQTNEQSLQISSTQKTGVVPKFNIEAISVALESNLISDFQTEQKALKADFNYLKKLFTL